MRYTWNSAKAEKVRNEHRVDFEKLIDIFDDPYAVEFIDEAHPTDDEIRFAIIGLTAEYGLVYLVFTEISVTDLHFITARKAENWMTKIYEQNRSRT
jgi:uncharacterized DUF497 family protein